MKKLTFVLTVILMLSIILGTLSVSAFFGSGVEVIAENTNIIKSGIYGRKITFNESDFKQGLTIEDFEKIKITSLPKSTEGTLMLAGRRVSVGSEIKKKNIGALVFIPASKDVAESKFLFTIDDYAGGQEIEFIIKFTDKINKEPEIGKEYTDSLSRKTQREIGIYGKMYATDSEGDEIEYIIISYPSAGTVKVLDKNTGEYLYTPPVSFVGKDSFIYVARDSYGNFSVPATVNISVTERLSETKYIDMENREEYNSAVAMSALGIMGGKVMGDGIYFEPDKNVTRAEFVSMAMKACGYTGNIGASVTFFDDDSDIPESMKGYIALAQKKGVVIGDFENGKLLFKPNEYITKYEAAVVMAKLTQKVSSGETPVFNDISSVPSWARESVYAMYKIGVFENENGNVMGDEKITRADAAVYLYNLIG